MCDATIDGELARSGCSRLARDLRSFSVVSLFAPAVEFVFMEWSGLGKKFSSSSSPWLPSLSSSDIAGIGSAAVERKCSVSGEFAISMDKLGMNIDSLNMLSSGLDFPVAALDGLESSSIRRMSWLY